jgi:hypothetical protein
MINNSEDCIFTMSQRKSCDKIHCNVPKGLCILFGFNVEWGSLSSVCEDLVLLAGCTSFDVFCDPLLGSWPVVSFHYLLGCFISSQMSYNWWIMLDFHDLSLYFLVWQDDKFAFRAFPHGSSFISDALLWFVHRWLVQVLLVSILCCDDGFLQ